ncbi:hypothetical protein BJ508DRAFT_325825 [Ascobolus immersus RN42]|uniref:Uncharacterized protein n=1 Tax=Ascobolus immersus RN42 TaxID=1160509 RepID=A0A3N4I9B9_ASCIM|nr:hypothetical protein BJ508DRAFT_325825 [Ascobolus immersus RN42]
MEEMEEVSPPGCRIADQESWQVRASPGTAVNLQLMVGMQVSEAACRWRTCYLPSKFSDIAKAPNNDSFQYSNYKKKLGPTTESLFLNQANHSKTDKIDACRSASTISPNFLIDIKRSLTIYLCTFILSPSQFDGSMDYDITNTSAPMVMQTSSKDKQVYAAPLVHHLEDLQKEHP